MIDAYGRARVGESQAPQPGALNRLCWQRYESESYLVHPQALARFIEHETSVPAEQPVRTFFTALFGAELSDAFWRKPLAPPPLVENYLRTTKARTEIISALLQECGIHGIDYTRFDEIAATFQAEEIHPEITAKLDFIQHAFSL